MFARRFALSVGLGALLTLSACGSDDPAASAPQPTVAPAAEVTATDSTTATIDELAASGGQIGAAGDSDSLALVYLFYRHASKGRAATACQFLTPAARAMLTASMRDALGTTTCEAAVASFAPFAGSAVIADLTEEGAHPVRGQAMIHASTRGNVVLKLQKTGRHWRIAGFGSHAR